MMTRANIGNNTKSDKVWCLVCNKLMTWDEYRKHAKKEFGENREYTKCCDYPFTEFDERGRLRCGLCYKFTKTYSKFIEYIVPERRSLS